MVLLVRLIATILAGLFKRRLDLFDQSVIHMRVWPNDLDLNVHANSGRYLSFMDVGRMDILVRTRLLRKVLRRGWRPMAQMAAIRYRRSLLPFERFAVKSRMLCWDDKWFYFEHVIEKANGELAAIASVRGLFRRAGGNVTPAEFMALAGQGDALSPEMPESVRLWLDSEAAR